MAEMETEEQRDERGKRLLARLRDLDLTPAEQHEALVFLSGYSTPGVEAALDRCESKRQREAARAQASLVGRDMRYPTGRPGWLGEGQDHPCGRCGAEADALSPHHCAPKPEE